MLVHLYIDPFEIGHVEQGDCAIPFADLAPDPAIVIGALPESSNGTRVASITTCSLSMTLPVWTGTTTESLTLAPTTETGSFPNVALVQS